jgi:hypothetical protein
MTFAQCVFVRDISWQPSTNITYRQGDVEIVWISYRIMGVVLDWLFKSVADEYLEIETLQNSM